MSWNIEGMHTAAPGSDAEDAAMTMTIRVEHAIQQAYAFGGGSADLRQAFDRLWGQYIYPIVIMAGAPI